MTPAPDPGRIPPVDETAIHSFLTAGWGEISTEYRSIIFSLRPGTGGPKVEFCTGPSELLTAALAVASSRDTYIQPGFVSEATALRLAQAGDRGKLSDLAGIVAFVADIDIAGPAHKKGNLPPTLDAALSLLAALPLEPTLVVHSGHGIQAWWLFAEPFIFDSDDERTEVQRISNGWADRLKAEARERGWTVDSVFDLTRVMRVPGTRNYKQVPVQPVTVLRETGVLYGGPSDFRDHIVARTLRVVDETYQPVDIGGLRFDPAAAVGIDLIDTICEVDAKFKRTWEHKRKDFPSGDDSPSVYQQSLASQLVRYDWDDQQIVDAIIMWNRVHKIPLDKVMSRPDYWERTLSRARDQRVANETLKQIQQNGIDAVPHEDKTKMLREQLGIEVSQIIQLGRQKARYTMLLTDGTEIPLGNVANFSNQRSFRNAVMEATRRVVKIESKKWPDILATMVSIADVIENPEGNRREETRDWLQGYFDQQRIATVNVEDAFVQGKPFLSEDRIWFMLDDMFKYIENVRHERIEKQDLRDNLTSVGCRSTQKNMMVQDIQRNKRLWNIPKGVYDSWGATNEEDE